MGCMDEDLILLFVVLISCPSDCICATKLLAGLSWFNILLDLGDAKFVANDVGI